MKMFFLIGFGGLILFLMLLSLAVKIAVNVRYGFVDGLGYFSLILVVWFFLVGIFISGFLFFGDYVM